ncbi:MAG: hypothetical protein AAGB48_00165 [Planctomycetota bacterium]
MRHRASSPSDTRCLLWIVIATLAASAIGGAAKAQETVSIRELIAERDALRDQLFEATARIERLEAEIATLRSERRGLRSRVFDAERVLTALRRELGGPDDPVEDTQRAAVPEDALASPASLLRTLRAMYFDAMRGTPDGTAEELAEYRQAVALWCRLTARSLRGKRTWLVGFEDMVPLRNERAVARLTVYDEQSGLPIGESVDITVPARFAQRLASDPRFDRWLLTAVVIARPAYSDGRATRGVFEFPPFIGPYAEFGFELDWVAVRGWRPGQTVLTEPDETSETQESDHEVVNPDPSPAGD